MTQWLAKALKVDAGGVYSRCDDLGLYEGMNFLPDRFNVRGLPYAFTARSPLVPVLEEIAQREENVDETAFTLIASDSSLSGPESIFILDVVFGEDMETATARYSMSQAYFNGLIVDCGEGPPSMFTTPAVTTKDGMVLIITGIHAASAAMLVDREE